VHPDAGQHTSAASAQLAGDEASAGGEDHGGRDREERPAGSQPVTAPKAVLDAVLIAGSRCQSPKSTDEPASTQPVRACRCSIPQSTERKATSSSSTVPSGITTNAVSKAFALGRW